jgi:hypothetical protein
MGDITAEFGVYMIAKVVSGIFAWTACVIGIWLIVQHLRHYTNPSVQKPTVRIILMIPVSYHILFFLFRKLKIEIKIRYVRVTMIFLRYF